MPDFKMLSNSATGKFMHIQCVINEDAKITLHRIFLVSEFVSGPVVMGVFFSKLSIKGKSTLLANKECLHTMSTIYCLFQTKSIFSQQYQKPRYLS